MKKKSESTDVVEMILRDHEPLKRLIQTLKDSGIERSQKEGPYEKFVPLLLAHAKAEEQSLYNQMKEMTDLRIEGFEGDTEHALADQLIQEINATPDDDQWTAKVKVVAAMVEHHIQEEEESILKQVKEKIDPNTRQNIGYIYTEIKTSLDLLRRHQSPPQAPESEYHLN